MATGTNGIATWGDVLSTWPNANNISSSPNNCCVRISEILYSNSDTLAYNGDFNQLFQLAVYEKIVNATTSYTIYKSDINSTDLLSIKIGDILFYSDILHKYIIGSLTQASTDQQEMILPKEAGWFPIGQCISTPYGDYISDQNRLLLGVNWYQFLPIFDSNGATLFMQSNYAGLTDRFEPIDLSMYTNYLGEVAYFSAAEMNASYYWWLPNNSTSDLKPIDLCDQYQYQIRHGGSLGMTTNKYRGICSPRWSDYSDLPGYKGCANANYTETKAVNPFPQIGFAEYFANDAIYSYGPQGYQCFYLKPMRAYDFLLIQSRRELLEAGYDSFALTGTNSHSENLLEHAYGWFSPYDVFEGNSVACANINLPRLGPSWKGYKTPFVFFGTAQDMLSYLI